MNAAAKTGEAESGAVRLPITDELDLHSFHPSDLGELLPAYFEECRARGLLGVRIVHGKGTGTLRTTVRALLRRSPHVRSFVNCDETSGSWGAPRVELVP